MAIRFAVRGNSTTARYSVCGSGAGTFGTVTVDVDGTAISGSNLNLDQGSIGNRALRWRGETNLPTGKPISVLIRLKTGYSGTPASTVALFSLGSDVPFDAQGSGNFILQHQVTTGNLAVFVTDDSFPGLAGLSGSSILAAWNPTAGTWYDILLSYSGDTAASGCTLYIDSVSKGSATSTHGYTNPRPSANLTNILIGQGLNISTTQIKVDEFIIFDTKVDGTSNVTLDSGAGLLNGASRTSPVTVSAFDGLSYTDPGIANVRSTTTYTFAGVSETGTCIVPTAANVKAGIAVDATTGTCAVPAATDVRSGTSVNATTGTLAVPAASNVRTGISVDATAGTCTVPAAADVRSGTSVDATTGSLDLPATSNVKTGVTYDSTTKTGTYDGSDRWTDPGVANVRSATAYKANSATNNRTGTCAVPAAADVRSGTGTDATSGSLIVPSPTNVKTGVGTDATVGTCAVPASTDVRTGVAVNATVGSCAVPSAANVLSGVAVDSTTGIAIVPDASNVLLGVAVGATTGLRDDALVATVLTGIVYAGGAKTGTLSIGGGGSQLVLSL